MRAGGGFRLALGGVIVAWVVAIAPGVPAAAAPLSFQQLLARERPVATKRIAYGVLPSQFGELWLPAGAGRHRVVILIHGGCWSALLPGHEMMAYLAEDLRQRGNAVWNIEYRRLGEAGSGYPGSFNDVAAAVDWVKALAKTYPLDLGNAVVVGHSAGGHFALWAAARSRLPQNSLLASKDPLRLKGAVSLAGIGDLKTYAARGPGRCGEARVVNLLVNATARWPDDVFADTSPAAMLPLGVAQIVISGAQDPIVPPGFGRYYSQLASAAGDKVEEITVANAAHFELIDPQAPAFAEVKAAIVRLQK
jgi:acetyl esterase/lipase